MSIPETVLVSLLDGKTLAAQVPSTQAGWKAWIWIRPQMRAGKTYQEKLEEWTRWRVYSGPFDSTVSFFEVRYVELSEWHLDDQWYWDLDLAIRQRPILDRRIQVPDLEALANLLQEWKLDPGKLDSPNAVDYPDPPPTNDGRL